MAAGSIIGAMGGEQSLERMGGFRKAMPFTYACFIIGGLALSGIPPFSGFFSKDEILLVDRRARRLALGAVRGRLHRRVPDGDLHVPDDLPRLPRRARAGGARARSGHLHHAEVPRNPANGEEEDTDVGFPGPTHAIAERALPMRVAMGAARGRRDRRRARADPESRLRDRRLPAADVRRLARCTNRTPKTGCSSFGLTLGTVLGLAGIAIAYRVWVARPGPPRRSGRACARAVRAVRATSGTSTS